MSVYLIPCPIATGKIETIPPHTLSLMHNIRYFVVEKAKSARQFIKLSKHPVQIGNLNIFEIDKHDPERGLFEFLETHASKNDIGIFLSTAHPSKFQDIVSPLISEEVRIPLRLQKLIEKKKQAILISNDYAEFKSYLLEK